MESGFKSFCRDYYELVYGGDLARLPLCRSTIAAVLDVASDIRSCGPIWTYWQFHMERFIGTLPKLVGSKCNPYPSVVKSVTRKYQAELLSYYGEASVPAEWLEANGLLPRADKPGEDAFPLADGSDFSLLPPRRKPGLLIAPELQALRKVLVIESVNPAPSEIRGMQ